MFDPEKAVHDKLPEIHISVDESETPSSSGSYSDLKPSPSWSLTNIKSAISSIKLPGFVSYTVELQWLQQAWAELWNCISYFE